MKGPYKPRRYSLDQLPAAVAASKSWNDLAKRLGLSSVAPNSCLAIRAWVVKLNIDTSHFLGRGRSDAISDEEVFRENSPHCRIAKRRFYKSVPDICQICGQGPIWNGMFLRFQVHHKNGNKRDNRRENLEKTCPNCHTQTDTWGFKKRIELVA